MKSSNRRTSQQTPLNAKTNWVNNSVINDGAERWKKYEVLKDEKLLKNKFPSKVTLLT